jgi:hypothetical protein
MSDAISSVSSRSAPSILLQPQAQQDQRQVDNRTWNDSQAGEVASATVAIQRNQNTARVENQLQQQLTATQASNVSQIRDQADGAPRLTEQTTPVAVAAPGPAHPNNQELAAQSARQESSRHEQEQQQQRQIAANKLTELAAQQAATARAPNPQPAKAIVQYQSNQSLLEPSGSNTHQVYIRA